MPKSWDEKITGQCYIIITKMIGYDNHETQKHDIENIAYENHDANKL